VLETVDYFLLRERGPPLGKPLYKEAFFRGSVASPLHETADAIVDKIVENLKRQGVSENFEVVSLFWRVPNGTNYMPHPRVTLRGETLKWT
jgi:hypothetical protein